jgi:CRISPR-associated protein Csm3
MNGPWQTHERLVSRHDFHGELVLETGLHLGSGSGTLATDAAIVRAADGRPFVPGSSLKGALRSAVERLTPNLPNLTSCRLIDDADCLTVNRGLQERWRAVIEASDRAQRTQSPFADAAKADEVEWLQRRGIAAADELRSEPGLNRDLPYRFVEHTLCHTCRLFGSTAFAAKLRLADAKLLGDWAETTEIRDGVGIDRDTETARPRIKFDLEVLPAEHRLEFRLEAHNLDPTELGLLCIGLQELRQGRIALGGRSSRGLGHCHLELVSVRQARLDDEHGLVAYLTGEDEKGRIATLTGSADIDAFFAAAIRALLPGGGEHAQDTAQ